MTSHVPKSSSSKKLGELLQEQEEPFPNLHVTDLMYETEKNLEGAFGCNFLKRSVSRALKRSKKFIPTCAKLVKKVFSKFLAINFKPRGKSSGSESAIAISISIVGDEASKIGESIRNVAESDRYSSASSTTLFHSCYGSDAEDHVSNSSHHRNRNELATILTGHALKDAGLLRAKEVAAERKLQWRCLEENKQHSPVSVLDDIYSEEGSPSPPLLFHNKTPSNSSSSTENVQLTLPLKKQSCTYSSQCLKSKRVLLETNQLLLDCVREVLEDDSSHGRRVRVGSLPGPEELGKLLWERVGSWSRNPGDETNTGKLVTLELSWNDFREEIKELGTRIGDSIMEDAINEIVIDIIY